MVKPMTKALIIGGGIAGPVAAMALRKAGLEATVYEAYDRSADGVGAFLSLAVNGIAALRTLDLGHVAERGFETPRMAMHSGTGKRLAEFSGGVAPDGVVSRTVRRADLYGGLRDEAVRRGVRVEYGKRLVDVRRPAAGSGRGVVARFADGTEAEGDLLIGADGLRSRTRPLIDPHAPAARHVGLLNAGGYARGVTVPGEAGTMYMFFGRRCFFCFLPHPNGEVWWFANPPCPKEPSAAELAAVTQREWRDRLNRLLAPDRTPALDLIRHTEHIFAGWNTYDFPSVPTWHDDRMVIIGDAAHATSPSSGQGASMAIEDGIVLAKCLRDVPALPAAFAAYERLRRERVEAVVAQGRRNGAGKLVGPIGRLLRDHVIFPLVTRRIAARSAKGGPDPLDWISGYRIDWDARVVSLEGAAA
jgi:FAD-dependent urate hydroxylase